MLYLKRKIEGFLSGCKHSEEKLALIIKGPSPINPKSGCKFANQCWMAKDICRKEALPVYTVSEGHQVCCYMAV